MSKTTFQNKTQILAQLWLDYRDDEEFTDFIAYADLGLPLAYAYANNILTEQNERATNLIDEAFSLFLSMLNVEDNGYEDLEDLLNDASDEVE